MLEKFLVKEIVAPLLIIFFSFIIYLIISRVVNKMLSLKIKRINERKQKSFVGAINTIIKIFIVLIALMMILEVYGIDTKSLVASLGVVSLVVGLALQDMLKDFIVGFTILFEDQFSIGDTVTINGFTGTVIYTGLKSTRLKAYTGDVKIISNRNIVEVINHTLELNKAVISIKVELNSDEEKVTEILNDLCTELSEELSLPGKAQCLGIDNVGEGGLTYTILIPVKFSDKASVSRTFRSKIKKELEKNKIKISNPQLVMNNG